MNASNQLWLLKATILLSFLLLWCFWKMTPAECADRASKPVPPRSKKLKSVPPYVSKVVPKGPIDVVTMEAGDKGRFSVVVYSKRSSEGEYTNLKSDIFIFDNASLKPKLIWQAPVEEFYEPAVYGAPEWNFRGQPVFVVLRQAGAAATVADVITISAQSRVKVLARVLGDRVDVIQPAGSTLSCLAVYERPEGTTMSVPRLMAWNGTTFQDASASFPSFFRQYLREISYKDMLSPDFSIQDRFCLVQILSRAGEKNEARRLAQALISESNASKAKNTKLVTAIRNSLTELGDSKNDGAKR